MTLSHALTHISQAMRDTAAAHAFAPLAPSELSAATDAYFSRGGKSVRPALCLLCAAALGKEEAARRALVPALSCELFHLFTLVHDDVIDHDETRRGADAAHVLAAKLSGVKNQNGAAEYGVATAILAGDALFGRSVELLAASRDLSESVRLALIRELYGVTLPALASGEALDTKLGYLTTMPEESILSTIYRQKTGALFAYALYAGALCALGDEAKKLHDVITEAGHAIGEAFQLTDDYLGLVATEEALGKPALSDLREGKCTFFVRFAMDRAPLEARTFLEATLKSTCASEDDLIQARDILLTYAEAPYRARIDSCRKSANALFTYLPDCKARELLYELFSLMIDRDH